jgi:glutaredoxin 3
VEPIVVFTSPSCHSCHAAVTFLSQRGLTVEERNIAEDPDAARDFGRYGYAATPIIVVGDEVVVGFNRRRLETLLARDTRAKVAAG